MLGAQGLGLCPGTSYNTKVVEECLEDDEECERWDGLDILKMLGSGLEVICRNSDV